MFSLDRVVVWLIIGLLGGSLAGLLIKRERTGFGILRNLGLGLVGAFAGSLPGGPSAPTSPGRGSADPPRGLIGPTRTRPENLATFRRKNNRSK
jgi:hypothetical protein